MNLKTLPRACINLTPSQEFHQVDSALDAAPDSLLDKVWTATLGAATNSQANARPKQYSSEFKEYSPQRIQCIQLFIEAKSFYRSHKNHK